MLFLERFQTENEKLETELGVSAFDSTTLPYDRVFEELDKNKNLDLFVDFFIQKEKNLECIFMAQLALGKHLYLTCFLSFLKLVRKYISIT